MLVQSVLTINSAAREIRDISADIQAVVAQSGIVSGLCHVFCHHTSASLMLCENADPAVLDDMESFMKRLVPENGVDYTHADEGPDDMPAHIRTVLSHTDLTLPVTDGRCALGTWQGVYLWEHRANPHQRRLTLTVSGEKKPVDLC